MHPLRIAILALAVALLAQREPATAKMPNLEFRGGDLPYSISGTWDDTSGFWDADDPTQLIDEPPADLGTGYEVLSWYWGMRLPQRAGRQADDIAIYYPDAVLTGLRPGRGLVRASVADEEFWLLLDAQRDAILRRYVQLGRDGLLSREPDQIELLAAAVQHGETIGVALAKDAPVPDEQAAAFWRHAIAALGTSRIIEYPSSVSFGDYVTLTLLLPEGRTVDVRYVLSERCFCRQMPGSGLPETITLRGTPASPEMHALMETLAAESEQAWAEQLSSARATGATRAGDGGDGLPAWALPPLATAATLLVALAALATRRRRAPA